MGSCADVSGGIGRVTARAKLVDGPSQKPQLIPAAARVNMDHSVSVKEAYVKGL